MGLAKALVGAGVVVVGVCVVAWVLATEPSPPTAQRARPSRVRAIATPAPAVIRSAQHATESAVLAPLVMPPGPEPLRIVREPLDPDYDAARLFGATGGKPSEFLAKEPRNEDWAPQRERDIVDLALPAFRQVDPAAQVNVECRTGVCRVSVRSRNKHLVAEMDGYPLTCLATFAMPIFGPGIEKSGPGPDVADPRSDYYLFFGRETRDRERMLARTTVDPATGEPGACAGLRDEWVKRVLGGDCAPRRPAPQQGGSG